MTFTHQCLFIACCTIAFCVMETGNAIAQDFDLAAGDQQITKWLNEGSENLAANDYEGSARCFEGAHLRALRLWGAADWRVRNIKQAAAESRRFGALTVVQQSEFDAAKKKRLRAEKILVSGDDYPTALALYEEIKPVYDRLLTNESLSWTYFARQYATCLYHADRANEAIAVMNQVIATRDQQLAPDHPLTAIAMNEQAILYISINYQASADRLLMKSKHIFENTGLRASRFYAATLSGLYDVRILQRRPHDALPLITEAVQILQAADDAKPGQLALYTLELAEALRLTGDLAKAQHEFEVAIKLARNLDRRSVELDHLLLSEQSKIREAQRRQRYQELR